ncbi:hypothetical protein [Halomarina oriensis]|uniref:Uncharacterized protein n=1 Tax=Halomarina oriensis TaxID=671145 RepID=A0A6B0GJH3_9EURY|nr:hypothetical protein [Halomarina oriensis]MWG32973.1 hypothetical protein [Halomarina oriensis]
MAGEPVQQALAEMPRTPDELSPSAFDSFETGIPNTMAAIANLTADAVLSLRDGAVKVAVPAYQQYTSNATQNDTETIDLDHSIAECPDSQDVVVWRSSNNGVAYYGSPDAVDYQNGTVDVTDPGATNDIHVFYLSRAPATVELVKVSTDGRTTSRPLYESNVGLLHRRNQNEQPDSIALGDSWRRFVATDMELQVRIDAPYTAALAVTDEASGEQVTATNALLQFDVTNGSGTVPGLAQVVKDSM